ncbi:MAG: sugar ABC transporter ATP-binding protein [Frankia sp.]|nr:sugar ABC transporter ATP-binding protein [Frankia sp.]
MVLLRVDGVSKRFGGVVALADARLSVAAGEVHAILGENGAGKSTLIQILGGALTPDSGELTLRGRPYRPRGPRGARRAGIACVYQELSLIPDLTVAENIWFGVEERTPVRTVSRRRTSARTSRLLAELGLALDPDRRAGALPIGEQQLVEIVKAVASEPDVLILDEATSALAPAEVDWLLALARQLAESGKAVLYISHRLAEVRRVADRVTVLRAGQTVGTQPAAGLSDDDIVTMMLGRRLASLYPPRHPAAPDAPPPADALVVRGLAVGHQLRGVSFTLRAGEVLGVAGLAGHGQRELFLALAGVRRATGTVSVRGRPVSPRGPRQALSGAVGIALLPEDRRAQGLLLAKPVRHNLTLSALRRISRRGFVDGPAESALTADLIHRLQIKVSTPEQPVGTLSGGNQQKVLLARLLATEARILLLLDPTRGVDVGTKAEIFALMRDLCAQGFAILFYSTDLAELVGVADRCLVLSYGETAAQLSGAELTEDAILRATMGGRPAA